MFETSVVNAPAKAAPRRLGLLSISLIAHTAVILGAVAVSVASVEFPDVAPDEVANAPLFMPLTIPPPFGDPNGGAPPRPAVTPPPRQEPPAPQPAPITAPPEIPNDVPVLDAPAATADPSSDATGPAGGTGSVPGPIGVRDGDPNSPLIGTGLPAVNPAPAIEDKVYVPGGEVKPPVLIRRVDPAYPEVMRRTRMNATVVVRCVIDRNGNVRDPEVVVGSMPPFNDAVMNAVRQWKYQPGSYRGQAVDTYFNLTVTFGVR